MMNTDGIKTGLFTFNFHPMVKRFSRNAPAKCAEHSLNQLDVQRQEIMEVLRVELESRNRPEALP
jgi:hypothetical protein